MRLRISSKNKGPHTNRLIFYSNQLIVHWQALQEVRWEELEEVGYAGCMCSPKFSHNMFGNT